MPNSATFDTDLKAAGISKMTGAHPRMPQALARRASIETTMGTYTDLQLFDMKGTGERLPLPGATRQAKVESA